jgi:hypothetical protein
MTDLRTLDRLVDEALPADDEAELYHPFRDLDDERQAEAPARARGIVRTFYESDRFRFWLIRLALLAFAWKLQAVIVADPRTFPDSTDYLKPETFLGTEGGYVAGRLPGVPAFFFLLARNHRAIVVAQAVISAASWGVLAHVLSRRFASRPVGFAVGAAVLVFSVTSTVALWDGLLLSESLSISVLVLLIAVSIRLFERADPFTGVTAIVLGGIWVYLRDPNASMLVLAAITVVALARVVPRRAFLVAVAWALLAMSSIALQGASTRWELALYDNIGIRVLTDRQATDEFATAGMPVTPPVLAMTGMLAAQGFETKPELSDLRAWTREHGRETYARYLLRNWDQTLLEPFRDKSCRERLARTIPCFNVVQDGGQGELETYEPRDWPAVFPEAIDDALGQRSNMAQYLAAVILCLVAGALGLWRGRRRGNWGWSVWLALASAVFLVLGWNAESQEVARHTLDVWVYVTLAVIIALGSVADAVAAGWLEPVDGSMVTSKRTRTT